MPFRVYVIDDDPQILSLLFRFFEAKGYVIDGSASFDLDNLLVFQPDAILLDWYLPRPLTGEEILGRLRQSALWETPIIFFSGNSAVEDRIRVLSNGADDFLEKPFELRELEVRLEAVVRRVQKPSLVFRNGWLEINPRKRRLLVNGELRSLSQSEWRLLTALLRSEEAQSRAQLAAYLWGENSESDLRVIDRMVVNLRRIIEPPPHKRKIIVTVRGVGYRFERESD